MDGGINYYTYVASDPVNLLDALGLEWWNPMSWGNSDSVSRNDKKWNDPNHVHADNCYEYAKDKPGPQSDPNNRNSFKNPGDYSGNPITSMGQVNCTDITAKAKADGMKDPGANNCCDDNYHLVYLVVDPGIDYHWYRKDSKPFFMFWRKHRWSHKPGESPVTQKRKKGGRPLVNQLTM